MNSLSQQSPVRRKIHYVDHAIQKWLLLALVALEIFLVSVTLWCLYRELGNVIEQNIYRIHYLNNQRIFPLLLKNSVYVLGAMLAANAVALLIADRIWAYYVNAVLCAFSTLMIRTGQLDFLNDADNFARQHEVVERALAWRKVERDRCRNIREKIGILESSADFTDPREREKAKAALVSLCQILL